MKILYLYQYFSTPKGSWGTRVYEFAKEWVKNGHQVTVITSIYSKSDLKADKLVERRKIEGIDLIILNIQIDNKQHPIKRIWTFTQYSVLATFFSLKENFDVVISSSGPITVGIPGLIAKALKRKKMVFEVRDLWPDTAIQMGFVKQKFIKKLMYSFEKLCYENSGLIVTLSPGSAENIKERYRNYNIVSVPNSANIKLFQNKRPIEKKFNLGKYKYAIYTGNIGPVNNSILLFNVAKILKESNQKDLQIILVGDGQQKEFLLKKTREEDLGEYFRIFDLMPKEDLVPLIQNSLASLIPLANQPLLDTSSPNKLFESLAAGVPVIQTTNGWIKDLLDDKDCGFSVSPDQPKEMVNALLELRDSKELRDRLASNALKVAKTDFDKKVLAKKMIMRIEEII